MEIHQYTHGNEEKIIELFNRVFKKEMSLNFWHWRFLQNPFTKDTFISLFWKENILIGHYAASPVEFLIDERIHKTALSMTTMIDPEYQGLGIFPQVAKKVNESLTEHEFEMIWGFPNKNSHYGLINGIGWKDIATVPFLCLGKKYIDLLSSDCTEYKQHFSFQDIDCSLFLSLNDKVQIFKTKSYLTWRYINNPINNYKIIEVDGCFVVYKVIISLIDSSKKEIDIVEITQNIKYTPLKCLISAILDNEKDEEILRINTWANIFAPQYKFFEKLGFSFSSPLTNFCYKPLASLSDRYSDYKNWDLSLGYSDVF